MSGTVFVFRNRRATAVKILMYDSCGAPHNTTDRDSGFVTRGFPKDAFNGGHENQGKSGFDSQRMSSSYCFGTGIRHRPRRSPRGAPWPSLNRVETALKKNLFCRLAFQIPCRYASSMDITKYRGRTISAQDVSFIQALIFEHPQASRRALSKLLCEAWDWRQPNGQLKDMICRGLMLQLHRTKLIELPQLRFRPVNNIAAHKKPGPIEVDQSPLHVRLAEIRPLTFRQVRRTEEERSVTFLRRRFARGAPLSWLHQAGWRAAQNPGNER